jgi:hypothetical protein
MRKAIILFLVFVWASTVSANLLVYDGFDYDATGNPVLGAPATGAKAKGVWSSQGNGTNEVRVISGSLDYPGINTPVGNSVLLDNNNGNLLGGANASRLFVGGTNTTGTFYYSFVASFPSYAASPGTANSTESFFAGFDNLNASSYTTAGGLFVKKDAVDATRVDLGITTTGSAGKQYSPVSYAPNDPVFIVVSFTFGGPATLDVFADGAVIPSSDPLVHSAITTTSDTALTSITNIFLRGNPGEPPGINIDELRVADSWADAVPEPGALTLLVFTAAGLLTRRRSGLKS